MQSRWIIKNKDLLEYKKMKNVHNEKIRQYIREMAIAERAYYEGFKPQRERKMFKEEIEDIEKVYEKAISNSNDVINNLLPTLLYHMEEFVSQHSAKKEIEKKLAILRTKLGKDKESEDE